MLRGKHVLHRLYPTAPLARVELLLKLQSYPTRLHVKGAEVPLASSVSQKFKAF